MTYIKNQSPHTEIGFFVLLLNTCVEDFHASIVYDKGYTNNELINFTYFKKSNDFLRTTQMTIFTWEIIGLMV